MMKRIPINGKYFYTFSTRMCLRSSKYSTQNTVAGENERKLYPKFSKQNKHVWETVVPSVIVTENIKTTNDWKNIRDELLSFKEQITSVTIDSVILSFCMSRQNYDMAYSYMEFLKQQNTKPNLATIGKYFKLYYLTNCNQPKDDAKELEVMNLYKDIRQTYKVLDSSTCENIIHALSITSYWRECLKLLGEIKITAMPCTAAYCVTAAAAFKNNEDDIAWQLLNETLDENRIPYDLPFISYLEHYGNSLSPDNFLDKLETLFKFFKLHSIKCSTELADKIKCLKVSKMKSKTVKIDLRGACPECKQKLQKYVLSQQDFDILKNTIFENVIIGKNVFCKTTPDELERFKKFIATMPKYDVVIDGLNVAYSYGVKKPPHILAAHVATAVKYFVDQRKKVLVLGRTHMSRWSVRDWSYVTQNADSFLAQSLSQDDPYLLYCALHSGFNTSIVSKDLMRGHAFKLKDPHLKRQFNQWLAQNQIQIHHINIPQGRIIFKYPLPYLKIAQNQGNCWHIPYDGDENENRWLCINK